MSVNQVMGKTGKCLCRGRNPRLSIQHQIVEYNPSWIVTKVNVEIDVIGEGSGEEKAVGVYGIDTFSLVSVLDVDLVVIRRRS